MALPSYEHIWDLPMTQLPISEIHFSHGSSVAYMGDASLIYEQLVNAQTKSEQGIRHLLRPLPSILPGFLVIVEPAITPFLDAVLLCAPPP